jgi:vesicle-associated membrane protein 7
MPLIYALVSRGPVVLAEHTGSGLTGNFSTVSRVLLKKIPQYENKKCSCVYDKYVFHYDVSDNLIYLCMSDEEFPRAIAFQFLSEIRDRFIRSFGDRAQSAIAFAFNADFARELESQMNRANNNENDPKINRIRGEIAEVKDTMMENIDKVLQRGEKIELLVDKTEELEQHAFKFQRGARNLKRQMCLKNLKWTIVAICALALLIYIILAIACGPKVEC